MRKMRAAQISLLAVLFSSSTFVAYADSTPAPSPTSSSAIDVYKAAVEQFKRDREEFAAAMRDRAQKIRLINQTFDLAVKKARQDSRTAMQVAVKPEQKSAVNTNLKSTITNAIIAREGALLELGEPPVPPTEPVRPPKNSPMMKDGGGKKNR
jgi:ABC-type branched-subunit amino acid transport system substrate-binding protein